LVLGLELEIFSSGRSNATAFGSLLTYVAAFTGSEWVWALLCLFVNG